MAGQVSILDNTFVVAAAVTNGVTRYQAVVSDGTDNELSLPGAVNAGKFLGITQESQVAGMPCNVRMLGTTFAIASGAIAAGDDLITAATPGQVASVQTTGQTTPNIIGKALSSATAAGDQFLMLVKA
ncbi:capsid cement protein [Alicyclobacillus fastidiosus]|uniref:DUF2190 family protein n=1 Tax=Alicyclobacillus fastidiosus TaxID=392011 RepID=A0ABV5ALI4_9BACL|nr:capsid cement protein [Alicyclobacillus fastidiosus]WEH09274.1 DUF2190 family protein [Alicyclobacillus fastidiosus]